MREVIPLGSIRRLLKWADAKINDKEPPYSPQDGQRDLEVVDEWVNDSALGTGRYRAEKLPDWWEEESSPPVQVIHYPGPDYKNTLEVMPGWIRNYYFTGHPVYVGNPKWIGTPYEQRPKKFAYATVDKLEATGRYKHRTYVIIHFNEFKP